MQEYKISGARYEGLDILKCFCAFLIVCIHTSFPGKIGGCSVALARIAVPVFFMITGFFYRNIEKKGKVGLQIKKVIILILIANIIYLFWNLLVAQDHNINLISYLKNAITKKSIIQCFVFNESVFGYHLWYLNAILYTLIIIFIAKKINVIRYIYWLIPILLLGNLIFGRYAVFIFEKEIPVTFGRNAYFVGIPYFMMGIVVNKNFEKMKKISRNMLIFGIILFSFTTILEAFVFSYFGIDVQGDHYISTFFLTITVFLLFAIYFQTNKNPVLKWAAAIGREYSTWIYILHLIFVTGFEVAFDKLGMTNVFYYISPIIVFGGTTAFVAIVKALYKKVIRIKCLKFNGIW